MNDKSEIAVIGMAGHFPGAKNIDEFWNNLKNGVESISFFDNLKTKSHNHILAKGYLTNAEYFDADFFKITPRTAQIMDPQFRLLLECVWEACENAGYNPKKIKDTVGVYASSSTQANYYNKNISKNSEFQDDSVEYEVLINNAKDFLATLIAYKFNFNGPAINIQTACSSSLVVIANACNDLLSNKCDMAIAGAVSITFPLQSSYLYREGMIYSKDGHCKAFSDEASGVVPGNGGGVIILKRLSDAIADNDHIYATIKGYATNNDGSNKIGFTAPSIDGQIAVLRAAAKQADIDPNTVSYIEAHGTGTLLGDEIEVKALQEYLSVSSDRSSCIIGSVKTNIGHLDVAAGMAGFIKTVLALKNKTIPASLHANPPNPNLAFDKNLAVAKTSHKWQQANNLYRAGVSSFGVGGTNAHVILEAYTDKKQEAPEKQSILKILPISARTDDELTRYKNKITKHLFTKKSDTINLTNIAYTLQQGRQEFQKRTCILGTSIDQIKDHLYYSRQDQEIKGECAFSSGKIIFVLSDEITNNHASKIKKISDDFPLFKIEYKKITSLIKTNLADKTNEVKNYLQQHLQLIAYNIALAKLYESFNVIPDKIIGYGIAEYAALAISEILSIESTLHITITYLLSCYNQDRCSLIALAKKEEIDDIVKKTDQKLRFSSIETQHRCIISGSKKSIISLKSELEKNDVFSTIDTNPSIFFTESSLKFVKTYTETLTEIKLNHSSNKQHLLLPEARTLNYWKKKLEHTDLFVKKILTTLEDNSIYIELGLKNKASQLISQIANQSGKKTRILAIPTNNDKSHLVHTIAMLWVNGKDINWLLLYSTERKQRTPIPTYPFSRRPHIIEPNLFLSKELPVKSTNKKELMKVESLMYTREWTETSESINDKEQNIDALIILKDNSGFSDSLVIKYKAKYNDIIVIEPPIIIENDNQSIDCWINSKEMQWEETLSSVSHKNNVLVLHASSLCSNQTKTSLLLKKNFYDLIAIGKILEKKEYDFKIKLIAITDNGNPINATLAGLTLSMPLEIPTLTTKYIEIEFDNELENISKQVFCECQLETPETMIRLAGNKRLHHFYRQQSPHHISSIQIRHQGTYLITGGLGGIGLELADYLAKNYQANLILISRTSVPDKNNWDDIVNDDLLSSTEQEKVKKLIKINDEAKSLSIFSADVANAKEMHLILNSSEHINGVIHAAAISPSGTLKNKEARDIEDMINAKVYGTEILLEYFNHNAPDFFVLCSALNTVSGNAGAIDYISANSYMLALAEKHKDSSFSSFPIIAIAWDAWLDAGMKARANLQIKTKKINKLKLIKAIKSSSATPFFEEHSVDDIMTAPGTLLISILHDTLKESANHLESKIQINNFSFLELGKIYSIIKSNINIYRDSNNSNKFEIYIAEDGNENNVATSEAYISRTKDKKPSEFSDIIETMLAEPDYSKSNHLFESNLTLGNHWNCIDWIKKNDRFYLAKLSLPQEYLHELSDYTLHPSLLDISLSYHSQFLSKQHLPFHIEELIVHSSTPGTFYSLVEICNINEEAGLCIANIKLINLDGSLIASADKFYLKRFNSTYNNKQQGLTNLEGMAVFESVLQKPNPIVFISKDPNYFNHINNKESQGHSEEKITQKNEPIIEQIRKIWSELLGVKITGNDSDFFDIGGDSLFAIQVCYNIKLQLEVNVSPDVLLEHSTLYDFTNMVTKLYQEKKND